MYDAYTCWCEANDKGKGNAIADAETKSADLTASIEMLTAKSSQLKTDIKTLKSQIAENEASLAEETEIRAKDATEFHNNKLDATQAIGNLKAAVIALSKHHEGALTQETLLQVKQVLKSVHRPELFHTLGMPAAHVKVVASLLQESSSSRTLSSAPQSGAIFGIMKQMKESFETNLEKSKADEQAAIESFEEMKTAKSEEIAAGNQQVATKTSELADTDQKNAQAAEDLEDTGAQLEADQVFLADVKKRCAAMDAEWAVRTKVRQEEMTAVGEALGILTDDDARDLMSKSTFLQRASQQNSVIRAKVVSILEAAAKHSGNGRLSLLALSAKDDVFAKIKESIDLMVVQLKQEQKDEVVKKDWCRDELHKNDMETTAKYEVKDDLEAKVNNLSTLKERVTAEIKAANDEIAETQVELKRAAENRQKANAEFQMTVSDQRATQEILAKALDKLKGFYAKKAVLLQSGAGQNPLVGAPPPATFQPYKKKGGAGGVMGMMENIIAESQQVEKEAREAEQAEQEGYEQFNADSAKAIASLQQEIADKQEQMANADGDLVRAQEDLTAAVGDLEDLATKGKDLHADCDYVMENFETRQSARTQEIEALTQAKQMMSGMSA